MPGRENRNPRPWAGVILLAFGSALMLAKVGWIAVRLEHLAASFWFGALGFPAAVGLGVLKLLRTIAFDRAAVLSVAGDISILSFALAGILVGLMLLRKRIAETA